uniref:hypothetical protein n=1 Tax=Escherichia coli TaxID=562 RepID=UPI001BC83051
YNRCMMLTGGRFGSSFLGYKNGYKNMNSLPFTDLSMAARQKFCEEQKAGHTGSNIELYFKV